MKEKHEKYYSADQIETKFDRLTKNQKIDVLYEAIGFMRQYNGREVFTCIALAMGYDNQSGNYYEYFKIED